MSNEKELKYYLKTICERCEDRDKCIDGTIYDEDGEHECNYEAKEQKEIDDYVSACERDREAKLGK